MNNPVSFEIAKLLKEIVLSVSSYIRTLLIKEVNNG